MSNFGVFLVRILPHLDSRRTRKTSNTHTFHAVRFYVRFNCRNQYDYFETLEKNDQNYRKIVIHCKDVLKSAKLRPFMKPFGQLLIVTMTSPYGH